VTGIDCADEQQQQQRLQLRETCRDCAVTGEFGTLHRAYKNGTEPDVGDKLVVFEALR